MSLSRWEQIKQLEEEIRLHKRTLAHLLSQIAGYGGDIPAPVGLLNQRDDAIRSIEQAQAKLGQLGIDASTAPSPYVGLATFRENDADNFFGREHLIEQLVSRVTHSSFLAVFGPSGSGKSSVVLAGLVPALKRGAIEGSNTWVYLDPFTPGQRPLDTLAITLAKPQGGAPSVLSDLLKVLRTSPDGLRLEMSKMVAGCPGMRCVLVIDQCEELWTQVTYAEERQLFIQQILSATQEGYSPILIVLTMRADFLHRAAEYSDLAARIEAGISIVSPMSDDELREAIEQPAINTGVDIERVLVDELIKDVRGQVGMLPLLQHTLRELWNRQQLTLAAYVEIGGVLGSLATTADTILTTRYTAEEQNAVEHIFLRLVQLGEGTEDTRRRVVLDELVPVGHSREDIQALIQPLVDARLLTTGRNLDKQNTVEVTHEALIRSWPTLVKWIDTYRADLRFHRRLQEAVEEWDRNAKNSGLLWGALRLAQVEEWVVRSHLRLNVLEQSFIDASRVAERRRIDAEEMERKRQVSFLRRFLIVTITLLIITGLVATYAVVQRQLAVRAELRARSQLLRAQGEQLKETEPLLALRLILEGLALISSDDTIVKEPLVQSLTDISRQGRLLYLGDDIVSIFISSDSKHIVVSRNHDANDIRDAVTGVLEKSFLGDVNEVFSNNNPTNPLFVVSYSNKPGEIRSFSDPETVISLSGDVDEVFYNNNPTNPLFAVGYSNKPSEIRSFSDPKTVIPLSGNINNVFFSNNPTNPLFAVSYLDKLGEVYSFSDPKTVIPLSDYVTNVFFSNNPTNPLFVVSYLDKSGEVYSFSDPKTVIPLSGDVNNVFFSNNSTNPLFIVNYSDRPGEIRSFSNPRNVIHLSDYVTNVFFSNNSTDSLFVVNYSNKSDEIRSFSNPRTAIPLSGDVNNVYSNNYSVNHLFVVSYSNEPGEVRSFSDPKIIIPLSAYVTNVFFSNNSTNPLFIIAHLSKPGEIRSFSDPKTVIPLSGDVDNIYSNNYSVNPLFIVRYLDEPGEIRSFSDPKTVIPLSTNVTNAFSNNDPVNPLFVVFYGNGRAELRNGKNVSNILVDLGVNLKEILFTSEGNQLWVIYKEGTASIIDISWLQEIGDHNSRISENDLVKLACDKARAGSITEEMLKNYLRGDSPKACLDR